jgi:2-methylisocitrate lyase-like PEP mutase family enzyme
MVDKIKAACEARRGSDFFILARTDAIEPNRLRDAMRRAEAYLKAGADGVYLEGPTTLKELKKIGVAFKGVPLAVSVVARRRGFRRHNFTNWDLRCSFTPHPFSWPTHAFRSPHGY